MNLSGPAKAALFLLLFFKSILAFAEDPTIDSLKNVLSKLQDSPEKVQTLLELGQNTLNTSIEEAVAYATAAKDLSGKIAYDKGRADAYRLLGVYYKKWGKYRESLDAYTSSLEISRKMKDLSGQSIVLNNFGSLYGDQGQETTGLEYYFQALKLAEQAHDTTRTVITLNNIGNIYLNKPNTYDKALEYFLRALPLAKQIKDYTIIGTVTVNIGELYMNQSKYESALFFFKQSLAAFEVTGDVCYTLNDIGKLYEKKENFDSALAYHQRALTIATNLDAKEDMAGSLLGIAQINYRQGKIKAALGAYQKAENIARSLDSKFRLKESYQGLAACYAALNDYNHAFEYQTRLVDIKDSIYNKESDQKLARLDFTFQIEKKQSQIDLLTKDKLLKDSELRRQKIAKNAVIGGLFLAFIIAFILYRGYRNKVKTNKILDQQKGQIENLVLNILPA